MIDEYEEKITKPRSRQLEIGNYLQTLLNSLTLEQIREAIFQLAPTRRIQIRRHADAEQALLQTGSEKNAIIATLLEVERRHPFKHCLLLRLTACDFDQSFVNVGAQFHSCGFDFKLSFISNAPIKSLTFEHSVEFKEWIKVSEDTRQRRTLVTRQPIVVRLLPKQGLLTINYPGFTHSTSHGGADSGYATVVEALIKVLQKEFGFGLRTLPIKTALGLFMEGPNRRVLRVKADVDSPLARLDVSSKQQDGAIEEALAVFLASHLPNVERAQLTEAAKRAFNEASLNSVVLFWLREGLFTRLKFWDIGTELFFIWNKETPSYQAVDSIGTTLAITAEAAAVHFQSNPLDWLAKMEQFSVVTPAEMAAVHAMEPASAKDLLIRAMSAGLVEPVYRLKTNLLLAEIPNTWSPNLNQLKNTFTTESGLTIDGSDPTNIEVAFRRIGAAKAGEIK